MRYRVIFVLLLVLVIMAPAAAQAEQFSIVGPRALGMGGANVAAVNDSTAVYWNPAALAKERHVDIRVPLEAALRDHMGLRDTWNEITDTFDLAKAGDPAALTRLSALIQQMSKPNTGADIDASTGLLISIPLPGAAFAVSALGLGYVGVYPTADTANLNTAATLPLPADSVANNKTAITGIGIGAMEPALSLAFSLGGRVFIGANAKMIYADTFVNSEIIGTGNFGTFVDDLDKSKRRHSAASADLGLIVAPSGSFSIGVVGRDLNSPSFTAQGAFAVKSAPLPPATVTTQNMTEEIEFKPQVRAGLAWKPYKTLTLAADYDITRNKTLVPGFRDQTLALGLEQTLLAEYLSVRVGAFRNLADSNAHTVYTAGLGTRLFAFRLDLAGAYDYDKREYQGSLNLALKF